MTTLCVSTFVSFKLYKSTIDISQNVILIREYFITIFDEPDAKKLLHIHNVLILEYIYI